MDVGTVEFFDCERAFGFIRKADRTKVFFRARSLQGFDQPQRVQGQNVEFTTVEAKPNPRAVMVRPISPNNEERRVVEVIQWGKLHTPPKGRARKKMELRPFGTTRKVGSHRDGRGHN
jgi:cold shock CspA family protein